MWIVNVCWVLHFLISVNKILFETNDPPVLSMIVHFEICTRDVGILAL